MGERKQRGAEEKENVWKKKKHRHRGIRRKAVRRRA
jgi:hypothetical protein